MLPLKSIFQLLLIFFCVGSFRVHGQPPEGPTNLVATTVSMDQIDLTWDDNADNEFAQWIERSVGDNSNFIQMTVVGMNVISYSDIALDQGTRYYYRVRATNLDGSSNYSNEANNFTITLAPVATEATNIDATSFTANWNAAVGASSYELDVSQDNFFSYLPGYNSLPVSGTSQLVNGLSSNTEYRYRLRAVNSGGISENSNHIIVLTLDPPEAPSNLSVNTVSNSELVLNWNDNADNETGYKIERSVGDNSGFTEIVTVAANQTSFNNIGLDAGIQYFYRTRATNNDGDSQYSNEAEAFTIPSIPESNQASGITTNSFIANWQDVIGADNFFLDVSDNDFVSNLDGFNNLMLTGTSQTVDGLSPNTTYKYRVRAANTGGTSSNSGVIEVTTLLDAPEAPTNLEAAVISQTRIDLSWIDNATNEDNYIVEVSVAGGTFSVIATLGVDVSAYSHTALTANTSYTYRVKAANSAGDSGYSNEDLAVTWPNLPDPPGAPNLEVISQTQIDLSWTDNSSNEEGFRIERSDGNNSNFNEISELGINVENYSDIGLTAGTIYYYRIIAYNIAGSSGPSGESSATTWPNSPVAPSNLIATSISETQINLEWTDNSTNEDDFMLQRSLNNNSAFVTIRTLAANVTTFNDTGLEANSIYYYRIRSRNAGGQSAFSNEANAITFPTAPAALAATAITNSGFTANWSLVTNAIRYLLDVSDDNFNTFVSGFEAREVTPNSIAVSGLSPNTTYMYRVRAVNDGGTSNYSNVVQPRTLPNPTGAPNALQATSIVQTAFVANWEAVVGATSYDIDVSDSSNFNTIIRNVVGITSLNQSITSLTAGTVYYYRVRAVNAGGSSPNSNTIQVTTLPYPTDPPVAGPVVTITQTSFIATWEVVANADSYELDVSTDDSFTNILEDYDAVSTTGTELNITELTPNTDYFYRVRTENAGGKSGYSNTVSITTLPEAPIAPDSLVATPLSQSTIEITWQDNSTNEDGFVIDQSIGNDLNFVELTTTAFNSTSYLVTGLNTNTEYFYRIKAINAGGESVYTPNTSATTFPDRPEAPSSLILTDALQTEIEISWTDNSNNESNFKVLKRAAGEQDFDTLALVDENVTFYRDTDLASISTYIYKVSAENQGGESEFTEELSVTTLQFAPTCDPISDLILPPNSGLVQVNITGIGAGGEESQLLMVSASSDNTALVTSTTVDYTSPETSGILTLDISPSMTGTANIVVRVEDDGPSSGSNVFFIERSFLVNITDLPDLIVQSANASANSLNAGDELNVLTEIRNDGNGPAVATNIKYYLSADDILELSSDLLLGSSTINALEANATFTASANLVIPATVLPDEYNIILFVDADQIVEEINEANNAIEFIKIEVLSTNAPKITSTNFPNFLIEGMSDIIVGITAIDEIGLSTAEFHFKGISDIEWQTRDIIPNVNNIEVNVPASDFDEVGLEFFFKVFNISGVSTTSETGYIYLKTSVDGKQIPDLTFGSTQADYNIFAVPLELTGNGISAVFEDDLGAYDKSRWRLFHYVNDNLGLSEYRNGLNTIEPGKGYWLISANQATVDTGEGSTVRANDAEPFRIDLSRGWNQIGNPYNHHILWQDVLTFNDNPEAIGGLRIFESGRFIDADILTPYHGAFVFSTESRVLEVPVTKNKSINTSGRVVDDWERNGLDDNKWQVMFGLISNGETMNLGGIGMCEDASIGKDRYDRMALPDFSFIDNAEFDFEHPEFFYSRFSKDVTRLVDSYVWKGSIRASFEGLVELRWDNSYFGENKKTILLHDISANKLIDLRKQSSYNLSIGADTEIEFYFGDTEEIGSSIIPSKISVGRPYPNPFIHHLTIPLTLSEDVGTDFHVNLTVYNTLGVQIFEQKWKLSPGFHQLDWNVLDSSHTLTPGLYFYEVQVSADRVNEVFTNRIIHVK